VCSDQLALAPRVVRKAVGVPTPKREPRSVEGTVGRRLHTQDEEQRDDPADHPIRLVVHRHTGLARFLAHQSLQVDHELIAIEGTTGVTIDPFPAFQDSHDRRAA